MEKNNKKLDLSKLENKELYELIEQIEPITIDDASTSDLANILNDYMTDVHTNFFENKDLEPVDDIEIEDQNEVEINLDEQNLMKDVDQNLELVGDETIRRLQRQELEQEQELFAANRKQIENKKELEFDKQIEEKVEAITKDVFGLIDSAIGKGKTEILEEQEKDIEKQEQNVDEVVFEETEKVVENKIPANQKNTMTIEENSEFRDSVFGETAVFGDDPIHHEKNFDKPQSINKLKDQEFKQKMKKPKSFKEEKAPIYDELTKLVEDVIHNEPKPVNDEFRKEDEIVEAVNKTNDLYDQLDALEYTQSLVSPNVLKIDSKEISTDIISPTKQHDYDEGFKKLVNKPKFNMTQNIEEITNKINDFGDKVKNKIVNDNDKNEDDEIVFDISKHIRPRDLTLVDWILLIIIVILTILLLVFIFKR